VRLEELFERVAIAQGFSAQERGERLADLVAVGPLQRLGQQLGGARRGRVDDGAEGIEELARAHRRVEGVYA
jgi:hypothetical protein